MLKGIRILILLLMPLIFLGVWYVAPSALDPESVRWLSGIVTILWGLEFYFFQRLSVVSNTDGLSSKEHERLVARLAVIRTRVWWIGGVGLTCSILIWILSSFHLVKPSPVYAAMVGFLLGICISYLILIPCWFNESQHFMDETRRKDSLHKKRADTVKKLNKSE